MRLRYLVAAAVLPAACALLNPARAADLKTVPRTLAKEPAYTGKPAYCLLAFGLEATTRVWVVRDGDTVYIDRNGNGDLTEAGEMVKGKPEVDEDENMKSTVTEFALGDLPKVGGKQLYSELALGSYRFEPKTKDLQGNEWHKLSLLLAAPASSVSAPPAHGATAPSLASTQVAVLPFAAKAADASVVHLDGPLTIRIPPNAKDEPCEFLLGTEEDQQITVQIGTLGLGAGTWAPLGYEAVAEDVHPQAEITYPPAKAGGTPITVKFALDERC
jgi:hypothetical protein